MTVRLTDLAGQEDAARRLSTALKQEQLHHALLFSGPDGSGKFTAAKLLAQILMCQDRALAEREPGAACGTCPGCIKVSGAGHADVHVLEIPPDADDLGPADEDGDEPKAVEKSKTRVFKVDQVREVMTALHIRPREGRFRILIIRDADLMTPQAQNALLKTLEEPPGSARIFLTTARPQALLLTVLSRCQKVPFRAVPAAAIAGLLPTLPPERARLIAALARGAPGRALSADPDQVLEERDRVASIDLELEPGVPRSVSSAFELAQQLTEERDRTRLKERLREQLELYSIWLRDQIWLLSGAEGGDDELANSDRRADIERCAQRRGLAEVLRRARVLEHARAQLDLPYNLNLSMIVEQLCLGLTARSNRAELERRAPTTPPRRP